MKILKLLFCTLFVFNLSLHANSHKEAAFKLLEAIEFEKTMETTVNFMLTLELENNPQLRAYEHVLLKFFSSVLQGHEVKEAYAKIYMESFTEEEILELVKFYKTDVGKKAINELPIVMRKGGLLGQQRVSENINTLRKMIDEETRRIEASKIK